MSFLKTPNFKFLWSVMNEIFGEPSSTIKNAPMINRIKTWIENQNRQYNLQLLILTDSIGNIFIRRLASSTKNFIPALLLQAHYDAYSPDIESHLDHKCSYVKIEKKWMEIVGTPFLDDSVVGIALILSILGDPNLPPPYGIIEALITLKLDGKFVGALSLDPLIFSVQSRLLLNFDSDDLGMITNGNSGCTIYEFEKKMHPCKKTNEELKFVQLSILGLLGGDMGSEVHFSRANAIKLIARCLSTITGEKNVYLCNWTGGLLNRFIPQESSVKFAVHAKDLPRIEEILNETRAAIIKMYKRFSLSGETIESNLKIIWDLVAPSPLFSLQDSRVLISLINLIPHGLIRSSNIGEEIVKISNNLARIQTIENSIRILLESRGDDPAEFDTFNHSLLQLSSLSNCQVLQFYHMPVNPPSSPSPFLTFVRSLYEHILQEPIGIKKIYWVLEPRVICTKYPGLDAVCIGPTEIGVFPSSYKIQIFDVQILYEILCKILHQLIDFQQ